MLFQVQRVRACAHYCPVRPSFAAGSSAVEWQDFATVHSTVDCTELGGRAAAALIRFGDV